MTEPYKFYSEVKVRFNETDLQGHVNFGQFLFYFDVGATDYMAAIGYDYATLLAEGVDLLYVQSHCDYHSPAQWPEVLRVHTRIGHLGRRSVRYEFDVRAVGDGRRVASGHIVAVAAARQASGQPGEAPGAVAQVVGNQPSWTEREIPPGLRAAVAAYEGQPAGMG